jgi:periplasmic protein TonB
MSLRLPVWVAMSLTAHAALGGVSYQALRTAMPAALFVDLTGIPPEEAPIVAAPVEREPGAPNTPAAASPPGDRVKPRPQVPSTREARRPPRSRAESPTAPAPPPVPAAAPTPPAAPPATPLPAPPPVVTPAPPPPAVPAPEVAPSAPVPAAETAPPPSAATPGGETPMAAAPAAAPGRARAEHGRPVAGAQADGGDGAGGGASAREGAPLALAIPGPGRGTADLGEYAAYYGLLRRRVLEAVKYPPTARRRGLTGTVQIEIDIQPSGAISRVVVVSSSSHRVLDDAAIEAIQDVGRLPFPAHVRPQLLRVRLPVVFELQ